MDWNQIEANVEKQTANRLLRTNINGDSHGEVDENNRESILNSSNFPPPPVYDRGALVVPGFHQKGIEGNYLFQELNNLRKFNNQQSSQIQSLEKALMSERKSNGLLQADMMNRIALLESTSKSNAAEHKSNNITDSMSSSSKRSYDDMVFERLIALEDAISISRKGEAQTENIGHVLGTAIDHLYTVSSTAENAREKSVQSINLVEVLLQALYAVGNTADSKSSPLDFLTNLATIDQSHRSMIMGLLTESLRGAISNSVKSQIGNATESLMELLSPQLEALKSDITASEKLSVQFHNVHAQNDGRFARLEERITRLQGMQQSVTSSSTDISAKYDVLLKDLEKDRSDFEAKLTNINEKVDTLKTDGFTGAQNTTHNRDDVSELESTVDLLKNNHVEMQTHIDDSLFDLQNAVEKMKIAEIDTRSRMDKGAEVTRDEIAHVKQANQNMQVTLEQQTGELYRRFSKLETKLEKVEKREKNNPPVSNVSEESINGFKIELDNLRQSIATVIFDFDDVKIQVKQLDNQIRSINKGNETKAELSAEEKELVFQKVDLFESSLKSVQAEMDLLQEEVVSLSSYPAIKSKDTDVEGNESTANLSKTNSGEVDQKSSYNSSSTSENGEGINDFDLDTTNDKKEVLQNTNIYRIEPASPSTDVTTRPTVGSDDLDESFASESEVPIVDNVVNTVEQQNGNKSVGDDNDISTDSGSFSDESSSSSSSSSSDEVEEDILGKSPPRKVETNSNHDTQAHPSSPPGPTPSDVLAEQLRMRATYEREQALKNISAKRTSTGPAGKGAIYDTGKEVSSPQPILSGTLLSGRRSAAGGNNGPTTRSIKPIYDPSFGYANVPTSSITTNATTSGEKSGPSLIDKRETTQCIHCLKRFPRSEMTSHGSTCVLRTEPCPNGCGAKVRAMKMNQHLGECPKK